MTVRVLLTEVCQNFPPLGRLFRSTPADYSATCSVSIPANRRVIAGLQPLLTMAHGITKWLVSRARERLQERN